MPGGGRGAEVWRFVREHDAAWERERLLVVLLNKQQRIIGVGEVPLDVPTPARMRAMFTRARLAQAGAFIAIHNQTSRTPRAAKGEASTTARMQQVAEALGVPLLDHLIFCRGRYYSMRRTPRRARAARRLAGRRPGAMLTHARRRGPAAPA